MVLTSVALTGASGMLGRHIMADLSRAGIGCMGASRRKPEHLPENASWAELELATCDFEALDSIWSGVQGLVLSGALVTPPTEPAGHSAFLDINVRSTFVLGSWAAERGLPLIYISSASVYENPDAEVILESAPLSYLGGLGGLYSLSKLMGEQVLGFLSRNNGLRLTVLRPSSLYGAGLPENKLLPFWLGKARRNESIHVSPPSGDRVNLLHAADMARAVRLSLTANGGCWNVRGYSASMVEIARLCVEVAGMGSVCVGDEEPASEVRTRFELDGRLAADKLGYMPHVAVRQGLSLLLKNELLP